MSKKNIKEEKVIKETKHSKIMNQGEVGDDDNIAFKYYSDIFDNSAPAGKMQFQMIESVGEF